AALTSQRVLDEQGSLFEDLPLDLPGAQGGAGALRPHVGRGEAVEKSTRPGLFAGPEGPLVVPGAGIAPVALHQKKDPELVDLLPGGEEGQAQVEIGRLAAQCLDPGEGAVNGGESFGHPPLLPAGAGQT